MTIMLAQLMMFVPMVSATELILFVKIITHAHQILVSMDYVFCFFSGVTCESKWIKNSVCVHGECKGYDPVVCNMETSVLPILVIKKLENVICSKCS